MLSFDCKNNEWEAFGLQYGENYCSKEWCCKDSLSQYCQRPLPATSMEQLFLEHLSGKNMEHYQI